MNADDIALGIDIGGTWVKAVALTRGGSVAGERSMPTGDADDGSWRQRVHDLCDEMRVAFPQVCTAGVCAPGVAAADSRSIAMLPARLRGIEGLGWGDFLGLPTAVLNDAQAALVGEARLGAARGTRDVVMLTLGTGVGGAVLADGRLLRGHRGRAGHLGHVSLDPCGKPDIVGTPGSLEDAIGDCTVAQRSGHRFSTTKDLVVAAQAGDVEAARVWREAIRALAAALAGFINAFDPELIVLGGGVVAAGDALFAPLRADLKCFEWLVAGEPVRLVPAKLGARAGALGAAQHAFDIFSS